MESCHRSGVKAPVIRSKPFCDCDICDCYDCPDVLRIVCPDLYRKWTDYQFSGPCPSPPKPKLESKTSKTFKGLGKRSQHKLKKKSSGNVAAVGKEKDCSCIDIADQARSLDQLKKRYNLKRRRKIEIKPE